MWIVRDAATQGLTTENTFETEDDAQAWIDSLDNLEEGEELVVDSEEEETDEPSEEDVDAWREEALAAYTDILDNSPL